MVWPSVSKEGSVSGCQRLWAGRWQRWQGVLGFVFYNESGPCIEPGGISEPTGLWFSTKPWTKWGMNACPVDWSKLTW